MPKVSVVTFGTDISSFLPFLSSNSQVEVFDGEVDFVSCFDSDLLIIVSNSDVLKVNDFFVKNRLNVLVERRLCGGRKVICFGNAGSVLFTASNFSEENVKFLDQWEIAVSKNICDEMVKVIDADKAHCFLLQDEIVKCVNQFVVFDHPAFGLDCKYTTPPNVAWGRYDGMDFVLSVENGALGTVLCDVDENILRRVFVWAGFDV